MTIQSNLITLREIAEKNYFFTVPIYQRLYVWDKDQIDTLLEDLLAAYQQKKGFFYLGGTLVMKQEREDEIFFELIDGQQRFTTLWMMSLVWREALEPFLYVWEKKEPRLRITFAIRPEVDRFFAERIKNPKAGIQGPPRIEDALATIESFFKEQESGIDLADFTCFILDKVQLVLTRVPPHTDLNKLFEVINNRGVQLQHHEILKARLLEELEATERHHYASLWDACAHMGNYVEKNLKDITGLKVSALYDNEASSEDREDLASAEKVLKALAHQSTAGEGQEKLPRVLADILSGAINTPQVAPSDSDKESYESDEVRSIISFPLLLQHTLRIWLQQNGKADLLRILDKELLALFDNHFLKEGTGEKQIKSFIELLWELRYLFDKHVIKWVSKGEEELHLICRLRKVADTSQSKISYRLVREQSEQPTKGDGYGFALLQSMLYHSQQITTHYWLTPLLAWLHRHPDRSAQHYAYLRYLDNHLLCTTGDRPLIKRTRDFLENPWRCNPLDYGILEKSHGTNFPHYWFYKLEFVLWYLKSPEMEENSRWRNFRITAKNSVEHISPQTPHAFDANRVSEEVLDTFGNLALVSRSINSEYSNKPFNEKCRQFLNKDKFDSLKMALIYTDPNAVWNDARAKEHQRGMITLIDEYLKSQQMPEEYVA